MSVPSLRTADGLEVLDAFAAADAGEHVVLFALPVARDDDPDGTADHFFGCVAEQQFRAAVPGLNDPVEVLADNRIVRGGDDG